MSTGVFRKAGRLFGVAPEPTALVKPKPVMSHHAVTIVIGARACAAVRAIGEKRFLSREAPKLPLKACDCASCPLSRSRCTSCSVRPQILRSAPAALTQTMRAAPSHGRRGPKRCSATTAIDRRGWRGVEAEER